MRLAMPMKGRHYPIFLLIMANLLLNIVHSTLEKMILTFCVHRTPALTEQATPVDSDALHFKSAYNHSCASNQYFIERSI